MTGKKSLPALTQADYESLAAFRFALRRFTHFSVEAAQAAGLTPNQHQALLAIKGHVPSADGAPIIVGDLAGRLMIAPHSAAELVARLCDAGMVEKVNSEADRRRVGLVLTTKAETALRRLTQVHLREVRVLAPRLMAILRELDQPAAG